jgi:uncharacterized membrane protein YidH (DUF202 family)
MVTGKTEAMDALLKRAENLGDHWLEFMDENTRLALIRTLLATERNYLAVERTQLAQLRTGLSLALIAPPAAATFTYISGYLPEAFRIDILVYIFLSIITIYGAYISVSAYMELKKTRKVQSTIRKRKLEVVEESEFAKTYLKEIFT